MPAIYTVMQDFSSPLLKRTFDLGPGTGVFIIGLLKSPSQLNEVEAHLKVAPKRIRALAMACILGCWFMVVVN